MRLAQSSVTGVADAPPSANLLYQRTTPLANEIYTLSLASGGVPMIGSADLANVHRIITEAHGSIHVSSRMGAGTTMRVVLPAMAGETGGTAAESELVETAS